MSPPRAVRAFQRSAASVEISADDSDVQYDVFDALHAEVQLQLLAESVTCDPAVFRDSCISIACQAEQCCNSQGFACVMAECNVMDVADHQLMQGRALQRRGRCADASQLYLEAISRCEEAGLLAAPVYEQLRKQLGRSLTEQGRIKEALVITMELLDEGADDTVAELLDQAASLYRRQGRLEDAACMYCRAAEVSEDMLKASYFELAGRCLAELGRKELSHSFIRKAMAVRESCCELDAWENDAFQDEPLQ